jgi:hypothetical protein
LRVRPYLAIYIFFQPSYRYDMSQLFMAPSPLQCGRHRQVLQPKNKIIQTQRSSKWSSFGA